MEVETDHDNAAFLRGTEEAFYSGRCLSAIESHDAESASLYSRQGKQVCHPAMHFDDKMSLMAAVHECLSEDDWDSLKGMLSTRLWKRLRQVT